jgi:hypothetical protein
LKPSSAAQLAIAAKLLNGGVSLANCVRCIAGPLGVLTACSFPIERSLLRVAEQQSNYGYW